MQAQQDWPKLVAFANDLSAGDTTRDKIRNNDGLDRAIARMNRIAHATDPERHAFLGLQGIGE